MMRMMAVVVFSIFAALGCENQPMDDNGNGDGLDSRFYISDLEDGSFDADTDGDGVADWVEILAGTDPNDFGNFPQDLDEDGVYDVFEGPEGPQGERGPQGLRGAEGPRGDPGPQGELGEQGLTGERGPQGDPGPRGETGATGSTGERGPQGPMGERGPQGDQGDEGPMGPACDPTLDSDWDGFDDCVETVVNTNPFDADDVPDDENEDGVADVLVGPQGPQGEMGATGAEGLMGPGGPQGPQGEPGLPGEQGPAGPQGERGLAGETGATGAQGLQGEIGPMGLTGPRGDAGPQGEQGLTGETGATGATGLQGEIGPTGPVGPRGDAGPQGPAGTDGANGENGATGATGPQGPQGVPGMDGEDGTDCDDSCPEEATPFYNDDGTLVYCLMPVNLTDNDDLRDPLSWVYCRAYCSDYGLGLATFFDLVPLCIMEPNLFVGDPTIYYFLNPGSNTQGDWKFQTLAGTTNFCTHIQRKYAIRDPVTFNSFLIDGETMATGCLCGGTP